MFIFRKYFKDSFRKGIFLLSILASSSALSFGQRAIQGIVKAADTRETMPGVNVVVKGSTRGVTTDIDGKFKLLLNPDDKFLTISFIGYEDFELEIKDQTEVTVTLKTQTKTLEEIVVIGYGKIRKSDLTGSVSTVKSADITRIPTSSPMQALQGKVAGLQIVSNSGAPGSGVSVRLRGVGTFNNTSPIYVVDGVIIDNIDYLNTSDIESMEVLKDASATTIYGARGANGVIMVTTKQAKAGQKKVNFNLSYETSIQVLQKKIDLLSGREFAEIVNEITPGTYNNIDAIPNTNWQNEVFDDGFAAPIQNLQLSASGASDRGQYYVGIGYYRQKGIIPKSNYERLSLKINNSYNLTDKFVIGNNITVSPYSQQNTSGNVVFVAYRAWPTLKPFQDNGDYTPVPGTGNPLADINYTNSYSEGIRGTGNAFAELKLFKGFTFKSSYGIDMAYNKSKSFTPVYLVSPQQQNSISRLYKGQSTQSTWVWENTINYFKEFSLHRIDVLGGFTMQKANSESIGMSGENLTRDSEDFWYINSNNINPNTVSNGVDPNLYYSMISYLFRSNYSFNNRYLFTATYRIDGSSKFTNNNRYAGFPALAIGWNVHNEQFMESLQSISNLKLKASWGGVGNEKISYSKQYSLIGNGINGVFGTGDIIIPGQTYSTTGNPSLIWETTYQSNAGIEIGFFENNLTVEVDYFNKVTRDILIDLQLPGFAGNGSGATITKNAAEILNSGFEFNIRWNDDIGKIRYSVGLVGNTLHNEVLKVRGTGTSDDFLVGGGGLTRSTVGLPVGAFYGYKVDGVFQNQSDLNSYPHRSDAAVGDVRYMDLNNDSKITDADRTYIGSPIPEFVLGLNFTASYLNFDFNLDFQSQFGNEIFNVKETVRPDLYNFEDHVLNRWHGEGTSNYEPKATAGGYNYLPSTRFVQNGSFFRLRNVSVGYSLPSGISDRIKAAGIRIYLSGTNVFTLAKYTGYTPEILGGPIDNGLDYGSYPIASIYSAGIRITF